MKKKAEQPAQEAVNYAELFAAIEEQKGIPREVIIESLERALAAAARNFLGVRHHAVANFDVNTGEIQAFTHRLVVAEPEDYQMEISLEEARSINKKYKIGDYVDVLVDAHDFGRIAAQTARQVLAQGLREAERNILFEELIEKKGEIVVGVIKHLDGRNVMLNFGKTEAILFPKEQIPGEFYRQGAHLKVVVADVTTSKNGPQLLISRSHKDFVAKLMENEIPEIADGTIEIKSIAREAGGRTKVAVHSNDPNVDPRGACIGANGNRIKTVVSEINGEKIDVVKWSEHIDEYVAEAISPAKVVNVRVNDELGACQVIVPDDQLSLAIGREGQNARLAAKLTGWKIDVKSESWVADN